MLVTEGIFIKNYEVIDMAQKVYARKKSRGMTRSELEKIKRSIPTVKPDKLDEFLIDQAKKYDDGTSVKYYPGMFD